jgi:hypothetical protein
MLSSFIQNSLGQDVVHLDRAKLISLCGATLCLDWPAGTCSGWCTASSINANTVTRISLTERNIQTFDAKVFDGLNNLLSISLSNNVINSAMPDTLFQGLSRLTYIDLSNNRITAIPKNIFQGLYRLVTLHLTSNFITHIEDSTFQGLTI